MSWGKIWGWGVVLPATLSAFAGALGDVVTGTLQFWWLLVPCYPVIAVATWRGTSRKAMAAFDAKKLADAEQAYQEAEAAYNADRVAHGLPPDPPETSQPEDDDDDEVYGDADEDGADRDERDRASVDGDPLVARPSRLTPGRVAGGAFELFIRALATFGLTFLAMVAIWAAIGIATWGRGYWYVYVPVLLLFGWFVIGVIRSGRADAPAATADATSPKRDPLVR